MMWLYSSVSSVIIVEGRNTVRLQAETEKYFLVKGHSWLSNPVSIIFRFKVSEVFFRY